jgi:hypothetical protein
MIELIQDYMVIEDLGRFEFWLFQARADLTSLGRKTVCGIPGSVFKIDADWIAIENKFNFTITPVVQMKTFWIKEMAEVDEGIITERIFLWMAEVYKTVGVDSHVLRSIIKEVMSKLRPV